MEKKIAKSNTSIRTEIGKAQYHRKRSSLGNSMKYEIKEERKNSLLLPSYKKPIKNGTLTQETEVFGKKKELSVYKNMSETLYVDQHLDTQINSNNKVLKRRLTEDRPAVEKILSEGEASSSFETISSTDSILDFEDISLSSESERDGNIIVQIKNDIFNKKWNSSENNFSWNDRNISSSRNQSDYLEKYTYERYDSFRNSRQSKYLERYDRYNGRDRGTGENDSNYEYIKKVSDYRKRRRNSDHRRRSSSKCSDQSRKSRESKHGYRSRKSSSRSNVHRSRCDHNRNSERSYEYNRSRSPLHKMRKLESTCSKSFDTLKSNFSRKHSSRKREKSFSKSPSPSVYKQSDNDMSSDRLKKDHTITSSSHSFSENFGEYQKEQTPFLVQSEKRLKEAEKQNNTTKELNLPENDQRVTSVNNTIATSAPEPVVCQKSNPELPSNYVLSMPHVPGVYSLQCASMPTVSVDNLPLVPGQMGLPIHITASGEIIPHDMDGRRIPIDPNGYYLPLDPTGRLFAHIVSPGNQAVPIHRTEDGVLRLPNSEPVPYGPSHRFPVNIDGNIILIGPDSKPLVPCTNLPSQPPLNLLPMTQFNMLCWSEMEKQQMIPALPQTETANVDNPVEKTSEVQHVYLPKPQPPVVDSNLGRVNQNSDTKNNKADLLLEYQKTVCEKNEGISKCKGIEKNLEVNPSGGKDRRSNPLQPPQKKTPKDECFSDVDMILDSNDSDSPNGLKSLRETNEGCSRGTYEIARTSMNVESILKIAYDNEISKESAFESKEEDPIVKKVQQTLKSLGKSNFKPPAPGRFIFSEFILHPIKESSPNASPLLRNRVKLSFLTPNSENFYVKEKSKDVEESNVTFKFLSEENPTEKEEKPLVIKKTFKNTFNECKLPLFTVDFAMQCDFTSVMIQKLTSKVTEMEKEVVRLREINVNLMDQFKNFQEANEKKGEELRKALLEIEKRNNEILTLKSLISEKKT